MVCDCEGSVGLVPENCTTFTPSAPHRGDLISHADRRQQARARLRAVKLARTAVPDLLRPAAGLTATTTATNAATTTTASATNAGMIGLTATINRTFARLAAQGPLDMPPHALVAALRPEEYCAARPRRCRNRSTNLSDRCWQDEGCGVATQLDMRERRSMTRRYDLYGDGDLSRPAAASQLGADRPWPDLLFLGDSVMAQIVNYGAACELRRAEQDRKVRVEYSELRRSELGKLFLALLPLRARQSGVVVVSFGLHFGNHAASSQSTTGTRAEFNAAVEHVFNALDGLLRSCARCGALFLTSTSQHFATADGSYVASEVSEAGTTPAPAYGCRALPAAVASESSPQRWREDDVLRIAARYPRVAVAPLTTLSRSWWDMHLGGTSRSWRGVAYAASANATATRVADWWRSAGGTQLWSTRVDCTHFCHSLFLWEPVWWALRLVVGATQAL